MEKGGTVCRRIEVVFKKMFIECQKIDVITEEGRCWGKVGSTFQEGGRKGQDSLLNHLPLQSG